jgi:hypothetical protein
MSAVSTQWTDLCARFNVKPKQFAMLLVITVGALGVLGVKMFVLKPKKAAATPSSAAVAPRNEAQKSTARGSDDSQYAPPSHGLPVILVNFESKPMRDPFEPFFVYSPDAEGSSTLPEESTVAAAKDSEGGILVAPRSSGKSAPGTKVTTKSSGNKKPPAPAVMPASSGEPEGLVLKAILSSRMAVLNTMTVEVGDVIQDEASQTYTVAEINQRSIVLTDGRRRFTIAYVHAASSGAKPGSKR